MATEAIEQVPAEDPTTTEDTGETPAADGGRSRTVARAVADLAGPRNVAEVAGLPGGFELLRTGAYDEQRGLVSQCSS